MRTRLLLVCSLIAGCTISVQPASVQGPLVSPVISPLVSPLPTVSSGVIAALDSPIVAEGPPHAMSADAVPRPYGPLIGVVDTPPLVDEEAEVDLQRIPAAYAVMSAPRARAYQFVPFLPKDDP